MYSRMFYISFMYFLLSLGLVWFGAGLHVTRYDGCAEQIKRLSLGLELHNNSARAQRQTNRLLSWQPNICFRYQDEQLTGPEFIYSSSPQAKIYSFYTPSPIENR